MMYPPPPPLLLPLPSRPQQPQRLYRTMTSHRPSTTSLFHWKVILLPILLFVPSCGCISTTTTTTTTVAVILMGVVPSLWMTDAVVEVSKGWMNDDFQIEMSNSDENDNIIDLDDEMIQTSILHYMNDNNDDDDENHCHSSHNHDTDATDVPPQDDDDDDDD